MGWSGDFQIRYHGKHPKEFKKLSKMVIPNSILRFDFDNCPTTDESVELSCTRSLSWYSADQDLKKIMSYLPEGENISMQVDDGLDYEEIEIRKLNGQILFSNSNDDSERYISNEIGVPEMLYVALSPRYYYEPEKVDICSLEGYIQFIANTFADDQQLMPIVQNFMYEVLDKDRINSFAYDEDDKVSQEDCDKLDQLRNNFATLESTSQFLSEHKKETLLSGSDKKQSVDDLPDWIQQYPESVINSLGGANLLKQLIETKGEAEARSVIGLLANGIMKERSMNDEDNYDNIQSSGGFRR